MKKSTGFAWALLVIGAGCCIAAGVMGMNWHKLLPHSEAQQVADSIVETTKTAATQQHPAVNDNISCLNIDMESANVTVTVGSEWCIEGDKYTTWSQNGDTMNIERKLLSFGRDKCAAVNITVPQAEFQDLSCSLDAGSLTMNGIQVTRELDCDVDAGKMKLSNMTANDAFFDGGASKLEYTGILTGDCSIEIDAGSIDMKLLPGSDIHTITGDNDLAGVAIEQDGTPLYDSSMLNDNIQLTTDYAGNGALDVSCDAGMANITLTTK